MQGGVAAIGADQIAGAAVLDDTAVLENQHAVGDRHRGQPMSDDQRGSLGQDGPKGTLNQPFTRDVEGRCRLVKDQHRRVSQKCAGERDQLALPGAEPGTPSGDVGLIAVRQRGDELLGAHRSSGRDDLGVGGVGPAEADIVRDGAGEQKVLLSDHHDVPSQFGLIDAAQIDPVKRDGSGVRIVKPGNQFGDRGFARTRGSDERDGLTGGHRQCHLGKHRMVGKVAEADLTKFDFAANRIQRHRLHRVGDTWFDPEHTGHLLQRRGRRLERVEELGDFLHRLEEHPQIKQERGQGADSHLTVEYLETAVEQHRPSGEVADEFDGRHEDRE